MKILPRYLAGALLRPLFFLLAAFTLLFVIADLMNNGSDFYEAGTKLSGLAYYYALRIPSMIVMIVPICLLLSVLASLSSLTRHSEITAMRACGISIYSIVRPFLFIGSLCFLFTAVVNEIAGPDFAYRADRFLEHEKHPEQRVFGKSVFFRNPRTRHIWSIDNFDVVSHELTGVRLVTQRPDGSDAEKHYAQKAHWLDGSWWFENGSVQEYDERGNLKGRAIPFEAMELHGVRETPADFMIEVKDPVYQSSRELRRYLHVHQRDFSRRTRAKYATDLHHRLAAPFACLVVTLLGIPIGAHTGRRGAFPGIMLTIGLFFAFYLTQFVMEYLAKQTVVPPWFGAWFSTTLFSGIGLFMIHRMR